MSQIHGQGQPQIPATGERSWERPAAADDIVDPIDIGPGETGDVAFEREQSDEDAADVPLEVKLTDALSMLADGGHDYGSRPVVEEEPDVVLPADGQTFDTVEIDESSKDA